MFSRVSVHSHDQYRTMPFSTQGHQKPKPPRYQVTTTDHQRAIGSFHSLAAALSTGGRVYDSATGRFVQ